VIADFDRLRPRLTEAVERRPGIPLDRLRLRAPVVFPSKVIAAPVNYRLHIEEMRPLIKGELHAIERYGVFLKAPSSVVGPEATMRWKLIEYASHVMTLNPGDLLSTGTPDGVGPLKPGDDVTIEIERVGRMSVRVALRKP
jgi:2-keto-4-pentenoate hydratase/2-oxohepta-3-ene-1,7-dioic acid hydratase in catechol pathway